MTLRAYLNCWKTLRFIDRADLYDVGLRLSDSEWALFDRDPTGYLNARDDGVQAAIWSIVTAQQPVSATPTAEDLDAYQAFLRPGETAA